MVASGGRAVPRRRTPTDRHAGPATVVTGTRAPLVRDRAQRPPAQPKRDAGFARDRLARALASAPGRSHAWPPQISAPRGKSKRRRHHTDDGERHGALQPGMVRPSTPGSPPTIVATCRGDQDLAARGRQTGRPRWECPSDTGCTPRCPEGGETVAPATCVGSSRLVTRIAGVATHRHRLEARPMTSPVEEHRAAPDAVLGGCRVALSSETNARAARRAVGGRPPRDEVKRRRCCRSRAPTSAPR